MDTEQQIRLNFLDEAEEYFDLMESNLLGLANTPIEPQKVDLILRSAHSIKGGAGMMSFNHLSQVAHRLEDFLKILRVRYVGETIEVEVETSLLQSVDYLRTLANLERQQLSEVNPVAKNKQQEAIRDRLEPILAQLRSHLGDLEAGDENALLSQSEDFDPAVLIFEEGVDGVLDRFESQISALSLDELAQELSSTAQELIGFGNMANLDTFIELCKSIQQQAANISPPAINSLASKALETWRRSHALVLRGSIEKLPSCLEIDTLDLPNPDSTQSLGFESPPFNDLAIAEDFDPLAFDNLELDGLQSAFELDVSPVEDIAPVLPEVNSEDIKQPDLKLDNADSEDFADLNIDSFDLTQLQSAFNFDSEESTPQQVNKVAEAAKSILPPTTSSAPRVEKMVRVPVSQLKQFNTLFEQLVLNRNSIGLRLEQLQNIVALMGQRTSQMERSNAQLRQWYDRASVEGLLSEKEQLVSASSSLVTRQQNSFDSLEMDRYSDIHLICQEQIESIVQLQEVATDITLGVKEVHQSVRELYYTTQSMQGNVSRTQMQPFSEVVKRFPRVIRDLNLQFDKKGRPANFGRNNLVRPLGN